MQSKLEQIKSNAAAQNWKKAIAIAARFPDLGTQRNAILDAHIAFTNPRWTLAMRKDVDLVILAGITALRDRYAI